MLNAAVSAPLLTDAEADELLNSMEELTMMAAGSLVDHVQTDMFLDDEPADKSKNPEESKKIIVKQEVKERRQKAYQHESASQDEKFLDRGKYQIFH